MKQVKMKVCKDENCQNEFKPFLSTQKFCSSSCTYKNRKQSKPRQAIRQKSKKQASLDRAYSVLRKEFLERPENQFCPVFKYKRSTDVHHIFGKVGKLYLDVSKWLAVSRMGHIWIHENPEKAYSMGFLGKSSTV